MTIQSTLHSSYSLFPSFKSCLVMSVSLTSCVFIYQNLSQSNKNIKINHSLFSDIYTTYLVVASVAKVNRFTITHNFTLKYAWCWIEQTSVFKVI